MADQLNWTVINDFSPGCFTNISPTHPDGAANPEGTYRCKSIDGGALAPLPRLLQTIPIGSAFSEYPAPADNLAEEVRIVGLHVTGPVFWDADNLRGQFQNNTDLWVATEHWEDRPGDDNDDHQKLIWRYKRNISSPYWQLIERKIDTFEPYNPYNIPITCDFATTRSNSADRAQSGPIVVAWALYGNCGFFPDDTAPSTNSTHHMPGDKDSDPASGGLISAVNLVVHQGRAVLFPLSINFMGEENLWVTNEHFYWTSVNDLTELDPELTGYYNVLAGWEHPAGYQVIESLSADELFLLKAFGGGIVLRGDLNAFTAINYPYVQSPGFSQNRGAKSPKGMTYPVEDSGVWLWTGGPLSQDLTPHLEPNFWRPAVTDAETGELLEPREGEPVLFMHYPSQAARWGELVMYPNNWLWDTEHGAEGMEGSWWQIERRTEYIIHRWGVDWRGHLAYGTPSGFQQNSDTVFYEFDVSYPCATWEWQSHPLSSTMDREVEIRECIVIASIPVGQGPATIEVRAFSDDATVGPTATFTITGTPTRPTVQRLPLHCKGSQIAFKVSAAAGPLETAPTLHELRYGIQEAAQIAR